MANIIHNEQIKLVASLCNGLAIAFMTAGVLTPAAVMLYGPGGTFASLSGPGIFAICIGVSVLIHLAGQSFLKRLKEAHDD